MNKPNYNSLFSSNLIGKPIVGFPYLEKFCVFCEKEMNLVKAVHLQNEEEHFKAIYVCENVTCPVFDEEARKAYVRISYSSNYAIEKLEAVPLSFERQTVDYGKQKDVF